jgi:hypothetical protein
MPPCEQRYSRSFTMALERDGDPIRIAELQSDFNGRDFGVADHVTIRGLREGPAKVVMAVRLGRGSAFPKTSAGMNGGVSFPWVPVDMPPAKQACLTYHVFLPIDFDFGRGGTLPGILGGLKDRADDGSLVEFIARPIWRQNGELTVVGNKVERNKQDVVRPPSRIPAINLERGKWVQIQQELQLNEFGAANGAFRLWVNRKLVFEKTEVDFLREARQEILGISGDLHFGNEMSDQTAPQDTQAFISPMTLRLAE